MDHRTLCIHLTASFLLTRKTENILPGQAMTTATRLWGYAKNSLLGTYRYPKYFKHWLSTVAHTIDCVFSKILNNGLNHGLFFPLFKFFGWKNILNLLENSDSYFVSYFSFTKPVHFLSAQMALVSTFFQMFIVLGMYNFDSSPNVLSAYLYICISSVLLQQNQHNEKFYTWKSHLI